MKNLDKYIEINVELKGTPNATSKIPVYLPHCKKTIIVDMPNNSKIGHIIRLKGYGAAGAKNIKGDLFLKIKSIIRLDTEIDISLKIDNVANDLIATIIHVPYLNKNYEVSIPIDTPLYHYIRLKGLGLTDKKGNKGDLYLHIVKIEWVNSEEVSSLHQLGNLI